jgi:hypothetical protein
MPCIYSYLQGGHAKAVYLPRGARIKFHERTIAALHDAAERLQSRMEASYMQQRRFKNGILDESGERPMPLIVGTIQKRNRSKWATVRSRVAGVTFDGGRGRESGRSRPGVRKHPKFKCPSTLTQKSLAEYHAAIGNAVP